MGQRKTRQFTAEQAARLFEAVGNGHLHEYRLPPSSRGYLLRDDA